MKKLPPKQELFRQEYIKDLNAKQAAIRARYSPKTAQEQASRMLRNVKVKSRMAELQSKILKENTIDAAWVLKQAVEVHLRCMNSVKVVTRSGQAVFDDDGHPVYSFQHVGANKALEIIGKHVDVGAFGDNSNSKVDLSQMTPWSSIVAGVTKLSD